MPAGIGDKFTQTFNSGNPNVAKVTAGRTSGASTLSCDNLGGWPTSTAVHFSTYKIDTGGNYVDGSLIDWKGIVSGNDIGSLQRQAGASDNGHDVGDIVQMNPTGSWGKDLIEGILQHANQDGTLANNSVGQPQIKTGVVSSEKLSATIATSVSDSDGQTVGTSSHDVVNFSTVNYDKDGNWDSGNNKFVASRDGLHAVHYGVEVNAASDSTRCLLRFYVNGSNVRNIPNILSGNTNITTTGTATVDISQGDELHITFWHNNGSSQELQSGSYMEVYYIG